MIFRSAISAPCFAADPLQVTSSATFLIIMFPFIGSLFSIYRLWRLHAANLRFDGFVRESDDERLEE
jgi:hypothetical protein